MKSDGYPQRVLWRWLLCESAILLAAGCLIGAIFGIYAQLLGSHFLATVTGFPIVFNIEGVAAISSFALVTLVALAMLAVPGYRAVRVRPRPAAPRTNAQPVPSPNRTADPAPLSPRQLWALIAGAGRELTWGLPAVAREEHSWRALAARIPDAPIREDALSALARKRGQTDGAALFTILPRARNPSLLRAAGRLPDHLGLPRQRHERAPREANGRQLHLALIDALDPGGPISDYYRHHPWREDGGYLNALVERAGRAARRCLPTSVSASSSCGKPGVPRSSRSTTTSTRRGETRCSGVGPARVPAGHEASWFELSGACSAGLSIFALLALASEPDLCSESESREPAALTSPGPRSRRRCSTATSTRPRTPQRRPQLHRPLPHAGAGDRARLPGRAALPARRPRAERQREAHPDRRPAWSRCTCPRTALRPRRCAPHQRRSPTPADR